jgi:hypothetical protein
MVSPLSQGRKTTISHDAIPGEGSTWQVETRKTMYSGTLIDELMKTVEQAEKCSLRARSSEEKLAHFYAVAQCELARFENSLAGAA